MTRYVNQCNDYTCGPIAIVNAIEWSGHSASLEQDVKVITQECRCDPKNGTSHGNFDRVLRMKSRGKFTVRKRMFPGINDIEEHLAQPQCAVIVNFLRVDKDGVGIDAHYALLVGITECGEFTQINSFDGQTVKKTQRQELLEDLEIRKSIRGKMYPRAWFLKKHN